MCSTSFKFDGTRCNIREFYFRNEPKVVLNILLCIRIFSQKTKYKVPMSYVFLRSEVINISFGMSVKQQKNTHDGV